MRRSDLSTTARSGFAVLALALLLSGSGLLAPAPAYADPGGSTLWAHAGAHASAHGPLHGLFAWLVDAWNGITSAPVGSADETERLFAANEECTEDCDPPPPGGVFGDPDG